MNPTSSSKFLARLDAQDDRLAAIEADVAELKSDVAELKSLIKILISKAP